MDVTIRFPQIDAAGILFYPRCFELLSRYFERTPVDAAPVSMQTTFAHPLRLGDRISLQLEQEGRRWAYSATLAGRECFRVVSLEAFPELGGSDGHETQAGPIGRWACGPSGHMSLSRSFEYVNVAVEEYLEHVTGSTFANLHVERRIGIPTVEFLTRVRDLPLAGDTVCVVSRALAVGTTSLTLAHELRRGEECLIENRQVVVFVEMEADGYRSVRIPADVREALEENLNVAA
ncbi:MAG: thioesterase family protein [Pseudomonadota bacterium]